MNHVFWLVLQEKYFSWPHNKSLLSKIVKTRFLVFGLAQFLSFYWPWLCLGPEKSKTEYLAIFTSRLVRNAGLSPRFQVARAVNTTSRRGIKQLGVSFGPLYSSSIFLWKWPEATFIVAGENPRSPPLNDSPAGMHMHMREFNVTVVEAHTGLTMTRLLEHKMRYWYFLSFPPHFGTCYASSDRPQTACSNILLMSRSATKMC